MAATRINSQDVKDGTIADADLVSSYAILAGRSGGQTLQGGTASGNNLTLESTSNATKGTVKCLDQMTVEGTNLVVGKTDDTSGFIKIRGGGTTSAQLELFDLGTERARIAVPTGTTELQLNPSASTTSHKCVVQNNGRLRFGPSSLATNAGIHYQPDATDLAILIESTNATNGRSSTFMMATKNLAGTISNVSIEALSISGASADLILRTGAATQSGYGTERVRVSAAGGMRITGTIATTEDAVSVQFTGATGTITAGRNGANNASLVLQGTNAGTANANQLVCSLDGSVGVNNNGQFGAEKFNVLAADNGTCMGLKINATQANVTAADIFAEFRSTSGVEASIAGTAVAGVIAYNTFTGAHYAQLAVENESLTTGMVMVATGELIEQDGGDSCLPFITKSTARAQKAVYGVYAGKVADTAEDYGKGADDKALHQVFGVGTGVILVTDTNGDVEVGDYLQSSPTAGHAEKQNEAALSNFTVAKANQAVTWADEPGTSGSKVKTIACTYHCS